MKSKNPRVLKKKKERKRKSKRKERQIGQLKEFEKVIFSYTVVLWQEIEKNPRGDFSNATFIDILETLLFVKITFVGDSHGKT